MPHFVPLNIMFIPKLKVQFYYQMQMDISLPFFSQDMTGDEMGNQHSHPQAGVTNFPMSQ